MTEPIPIRRRPDPGQLRYLAGKLREGMHPEAAAIALEMMADEIAEADPVRSLVSGYARSLGDRLDPATAATDPRGCRCANCYGQPAKGYHHVTPATGETAWCCCDIGHDHG